MSRQRVTSRTCQVCQQTFPSAQVMPAAMVRQNIARLITQDNPHWSADGYICFPDLNHYRTLYVEDVLASERGELSQLESEVVQSLKEQELVSENVSDMFESERSIGSRLADKLAAFGGSWTFLTCFAAFLALWILINSLVILSRPFDPYPYILLNLMLSCVAAIQAPVIMMSQNRQEAKDRVQAEHDFRVNLKAELEIRQLHAKLDMLLSNQWQRLLEIQEVQLEVMEHLSGDKRKTSS